MHSRSLGYFETLLYYGHVRGISQMTMTLLLQGPLNEEMFHQAFQGLFYRHPMLRSTIHLREHVLHYDFGNDFSTIPIDFYAEDEAVDYDAIFKEQSQQQLPLDKRNWSVAIIQTSKDTYQLIWHISHVIADGLSFVNLTRELIENLDRQVEGKQIKTVSLPLFDEVESYLPHKITIQEYLAYQQKKSERLKTLELTPLLKEERSHTAYFFRETDEKSLERLREKCVEEGVTLNNSVMASLVHAYCERVVNTQSIQLGTAINLRNKCEPNISTEICGNFFSAITVTLEKDEIKLPHWELARRYREKLGKEIARGFFLPTQYDNVDMHETVKRFMLPQSNILQEGLGSSYMGEINLTSRNLQITDYKIHPKHAGGNNLIVSIYNNKMKFTVAYAPEYRSNVWANELADAIMNNLQTAHSA